MIEGWRKIYPKPSSLIREGKVMKMTKTLYILAILAGFAFGSFAQAGVYIDGDTVGVSINVPFGGSRYTRETQNDNIVLARNENNMFSTQAQCEQAVREGSATSYRPRDITSNYRKNLPNPTNGTHVIASERWTCAFMNVWGPDDKWVSLAPGTEFREVKVKGEMKVYALHACGNEIRSIVYVDPQFKAAAPLKTATVVGATLREEKSSAAPDFFAGNSKEEERGPGFWCFRSWGKGLTCAAILAVGAYGIGLVMDGDDDEGPGVATGPVGPGVTTGPAGPLVSTGTTGPAVETGPVALPDQVFLGPGVL